jgi:hypothetical protein
MLVNVALDRDDAPESTLRLSERELQLPFDWGMVRENSGVSLRIRYNVGDPRAPADAPGGGYYVPWADFGDGDAAWLDDAHLAALGFDAPRLRAQAKVKRGGAPTSKDVLLVLEQDGPAYAAAVDRARHRRDEEAAAVAANPGNDELARRAKRAAEAASFAERQASRLFVVDAGLDRDALRSKYPDRQRYAIVRGVLRPVVVLAADRVARVDRLDIGEIAVPDEFRPVFDRLTPVDRTRPRNEQRDRFEAIVSWGRRLEPWIASVSVRRGTLGGRE